MVTACDHGLVPPPEEPELMKPGFGGAIWYSGKWPPSDSLKDLRIVAFRDFPPKDIVSEVLSGNAEVYPPLGSSSLPFGVDSTNYSFFVPAGTYEYIAVAQQYGPNVFADWKAVGVYTMDPYSATPATVVVPSGPFVWGIDLIVDFDHPPPQPFEVR
jgi:hypothetical protein